MLFESTFCGGRGRGGYPDQFILASKMVNDGIACTMAVSRLGMETASVNGLELLGACAGVRPGPHVLTKEPFPPCAQTFYCLLRGHDHLSFLNTPRSKSIRR